MTQERRDPTLKDAGEGPRIGVYICHCGGNISDVVDVERVCLRCGKKENHVKPRQ